MKYILHAFEAFFILLCELVYSVARYAYDLLISIAESNVFNNDVIREFSSRIYVLLGIFMLFKVSFSLINYIVNPDDFTDKQKGLGKLVPNIMITLILIVFTPRIFAELTDLQHLLTSQRFFEKIVLGPNYIETVDDTVGENLAVNVFGAFYYYPKDKMNDPNIIRAATVLGSDESRRYGSLDSAFDSASLYNAYEGIWDETSDNHPLMALIAGGILVLVLIQFCFDIAIRTVKFGFLQLIAPIPIVSRIDPKSAKDGMFAKWFKLCYKTYLDLFIRLIALYFAIAVIGVIMQNFQSGAPEINGGVQGTQLYMLQAFLIVGALMFAKQLPKMLEDLFGFKLDGGFTLNPVKRIEKDAIGGKFMTGAAGGLAQGAIGAVTGAGVGSLVTGTLGGAFRNKGFSDAWTKGKTSNKNMRTALLNGSTFGGRMKTRVENFIGTGGEDARIEREKYEYQKELDDLKEQKDTIEAEIAPTRQRISENKAYGDSIKSLEDRAKQQIKDGAAGTISTKYFQLEAKYERLKNEGASATYTTASGEVLSGEDAVAQARQDMSDYLSKEGLYQYMTEASTHTGNFRSKEEGGLGADKSFDNLREYAEQKGKALGLVGADGLTTDGEKLHGIMGQQKGKVGELERNIFDKEREINNIDTQIKEINETIHTEFAEREKTSKANQDAIK